MTHINRTLFVGVGGVGSALLGPIAALLANDPNCQGEADHKGVRAKPAMTICDGDSYEEKNLKNQCITQADVGRNKAEVGATLVSGLVDTEVWPMYIDGPLAVQSWLVSRRTEQQKRMDAGLFGGVALIVTSVDDDHCRNYIYEALEECPKVSVLIIDPSNGAGDDAEDVDVVSYLRVYDGTQSIEPWPSPLVKYKQLREPEGFPKNAEGDCMEKAVSLPQLRTSNMMAATLAYSMVETWLSETGLAEGWHAHVGSMKIGLCGSRLPTAEEMMA